MMAFATSKKKVPMVHVQSDGPVGFGTTVCNDEGEQIRGVRRATIHISPDKVNRIEMELLTSKIDVKGVPVFAMSDPLTGELKAVRSVVFVDGSCFGKCALCDQDAVGVKHAVTDASTLGSGPDRACIRVRDPYPVCAVHMAPENR